MVTGNADVGLQERRRAARAMLARIGLASRPDRRRGDEIDDRGQREFAGESFVTKVARDGAADFWKKPNEAGKVLGLALSRTLSQSG